MRQNRQEDSIVANPGSTPDEAIGALIGWQVHGILEPIVERHGCRYITTGPVNIKTGKSTRLTLTDAAGNNYSIGAVITNRSNGLMLAWFHASSP